MREILFRGKRTDNGEWLYGDLWQKPYSSKNCICIASTIEDFGIRSGFIVIPETVGQYTGLKDKHGTKIFEGDILRADNGHIGCVAFGGLAQFGKYCKCHKEFESIYPDNETVIGNIHDNPELFREV